MKTIISIVEANVVQQPYLTKMLIEELVNLSSLSRKLKPHVDLELHKDVKIGSIVMALKRLTLVLQAKEIIQAKKLSNIYGNINVRFNLSIFTFENSKTIVLAHRELLNKLSEVRNMFYTVSRGVTETSVVISTKYDTILENVFKNEISLIKVKKLSAISVKFTAEYANTPGLYHLIFSRLAWYGINIQESFSTTSEISIFINEKDTDKAFTIIKDIFVRKKSKDIPLIQQYNIN